MKKYILILTVVTSIISFSKINIIISPSGAAVNTVAGYQNSYNRQYAKFLDDCQYYRVVKTWTNGRDTYAQLENGNIQKLKGRHIPYMNVGDFCNIPEGEE